MKAFINVFFSVINVLSSEPPRVKGNIMLGFKLLSLGEIIFIKFINSAAIFE